MNPTPDSDRSVPVTAERSHDGLTKRKGLLVAVAGTLVFDGELEPWTHKPAQSGRPEMYRSKVAGVEIWLKGMNPPEAGSPIVGTIEVKLNEVDNDKAGSRGGTSQYLYVNVLACAAPPTATVSIVRPPKSGGRKVLPDDFDESMDFSVDRHGQPWQIVQINDGTARRSRAADERDRRVLRTIGQTADVDVDLARFIAKKVL